MTIALLILTLLSNRPATPCPGWLGLGFRYQPPAHGNADGWIYIQRLAPAGPAERAGLVAGDVISAIDGQPIRYIDERSVLQRFSQISAGAVVHLTIRRGTRTVVRNVTAVSPSKEQCAKWRESSEMARAKPPSY
jgi:S1-C subfamily serine protease